MKPLVRSLRLIGMAVLLTTGCGPGKPRTSLHQAVQDGNYPGVRQHIAARSDLNAPDQSGWTALHLAAINGDLPMVQLLATAGADPGKPGARGKTPVAVAREKGQTSIVQYLEGLPKAAPGPTGQEKRGRGLSDGGLGVSGVLDAQ
jgi:ankyrin repeat protein